MPWPLTTQKAHLVDGALFSHTNKNIRFGRLAGLIVVLKECKMPKMKTKSSVKKRFKVTATGKIMGAQAGKQHGMIKRSNKFLRNARGTSALSEPDARIIRKMMPYGVK